MGLAAVLFYCDPVFGRGSSDTGWTITRGPCALHVPSLTPTKMTAAGSVEPTLSSIWVSPASTTCKPTLIHVYLRPSVPVLAPFGLWKCSHIPALAARSSVFYSIYRNYLSSHTFLPVFCFLWMEWSLETNKWNEKGLRGLTWGEIGMTMSVVLTCAEVRAKMEENERGGLLISGLDGWWFWFLGLGLGLEEVCRCPQKLRVRYLKKKLMLFRSYCIVRNRADIMESRSIWWAYLNGLTPLNLSGLDFTMLSLPGVERVTIISAYLELSL